MRREERHSENGCKADIAAALKRNKEPGKGARNE